MTGFTATNYVLTKGRLRAKSWQRTRSILTRNIYLMLGIGYLAKQKKTQEYNSRFTYGLYQIEKEINLRNEDKEYIYPNIHNDVQVLKALLTGKSQRPVGQ